MTGATCERGGCGNGVKAHGLCQAHYDRERGRHRHREDRVLATRARNRATAALVKAHPDEFAALLTKATDDVQAEYKTLTELATEAGVAPETGVLRLRRGPASPDADSPLDRLDTSSGCEPCGGFHAVGHVCEQCRKREDDEWETAPRRHVSKPVAAALTPEQRIERLLRAGKSAQWVASNLIEPMPLVMRVLTRLRNEERQAVPS